MANVKGRGVTVEIAATYSGAKTVTGITNANPAVATSTTHGLSNNTVGYLSGGIAQLDGGAYRLKNVATDTFQLQGVDSTSFSTFSGTTTFTPVATWAALAECTGYEIGGGASEKLDVTALSDVTRQEEVGLLPAQTVTLNLIAQDGPSAGMQLIESAVMQQSDIVLRITLPSGAVRIARGMPSLPNESVAVGQVGSQTMDIATKGFALKLAA